METEQININLVLNGHGWDNHWPVVNIKIDDITHKENVEIINQQTLSFEVELEPGDHILSIELLNKNPKEDVVLDTNGSIQKEKYIEIISLHMDEIEIPFNILYNYNFYQVDDPNYPPENCPNPVNPRVNDMQMSWIGTWSIKFTSPLYIWLLENF